MTAKRLSPAIEPLLREVAVRPMRTEASAQPILVQVSASQSGVGRILKVVWSARPRFQEQCRGESLQ